MQRNSLSFSPRILRRFRVSGRWSGQRRQGNVLCKLPRGTRSVARASLLQAACEQRRRRATRSFDASAALPQIFAHYFSFSTFRQSRSKAAGDGTLPFQSRARQPSLIGHATPCPPQRLAAAPQRGTIERNGASRERETRRKKKSAVMLPAGSTPFPQPLPLLLLSKKKKGSAPPPQQHPLQQQQLHQQQQQQQHRPTKPRSPPHSFPPSTGASSRATSPGSRRSPSS